MGKTNEEMVLSDPWWERSVVTRCFWTSDTFSRQHAHFLITAQSTEGFRLSFLNKLLLKYIMDL